MAVPAKKQALVLDEAHHVAATNWSRLKSAFHSVPILQFLLPSHLCGAAPLVGCHSPRVCAAHYMKSIGNGGAGYPPR